MSNLGLGFLLMGVGMVTVFVILIIVIYGSQLMINIVNRIAPEQQESGGRAASDGGGVTAAGADVRAVLDAAVAQLTAGKGHIINVTKIN